LASQLAGLPGRTVLMLDTVYSDNVLGSLRKALPHHINRVVNQMAAPEVGLVVFSGSTGRQPAQSEPGRGQGFFAKAVVEGLDGKAAQADGKITHSSLATWVDSRVRDLSRGQQVPGKGNAEGVPEFSLGGKR
jgi:uncharacterized caspase-like protein